MQLGLSLYILVMDAKDEPMIIEGARVEPMRSNEVFPPKYGV